MSRLPPFFAELGIEDDAEPLDERTLRRAYARRLKRIDIEAEPQRFQDLREALEAALRWSAMRERAQQAGDDATPPEGETDGTPVAGREPIAKSPPSPGFVEPETVAEAVFATFQPQVTTFLDRALAQDAVQHALADARLASIDARTFFEWRVARLLAEGWQRGHEHLLAPAVDLFGWDDDHARLANFGQVGALLAAAIRDMSVMQGFTEAQRVAIPPVLERLRAAAPPDAATLADEIAALQFLVQRVPNWLRIVTPVDPVNERFQRWRDRPAPPPGSLEVQPQFVAGKPSSNAAIIAMVVLIVIILLGALGSAGDRASSSNAATPAVTQDAATARELEQRQRRADLLLESIRRAQAQPEPPASQHPRPAAAPPWPDPFPQPPATSNLDQPWYAPDWAKDPAKH